MTHYACHDRLPFVDLAKDCQFTKTDLGKADSRCDGCRWRAV